MKQIEKIIPEITDEEKSNYNWDTFPFLALPDGAHQLQQGSSYFIMEGKNGAKPLFCCSVFEQMPTAELLVRTEDMNRTSVQKAVCVVAKKSYFGAIRSRLIPTTEAFFKQVFNKTTEQRDFTNTKLLNDLYDCISIQFSGKIDPSCYLIGLPIKFVLAQYGEQIMTIFKAILLEKRIIIYSGKDVSLLVSTILLAIVSLYPGSIESLEDEDEYEENEERKDDSALMKSNEEIIDDAKFDSSNQDDSEKERKTKSNELINERQNAGQTSLVLISNVPKCISEERLKKALTKLCSIRSFALLLDENGEFEHGQFGFAKFDSPLLADEFVKRYDSKIIIRGTRLKLKRIGSTSELQKLKGAVSAFGSFFGSAVKVSESPQLRSESPKECASAVVGDKNRERTKAERDAAFGFPMKLFSRYNRVFPYLCLQDIDTLNEDGGFICGANNLLFTTETAHADVILNLTTKELMISPSSQNELELTISDKRFVNFILKGVIENNGKEVLNTLTPDERLTSISSYKGSDEWILLHFRHYIECLYSAISEIPSFSNNEIDTTEFGMLSDFNRKFAEKFITTHHFAKWRKAQLAKDPVVELATFAPPMHPMGPSNIFGELKSKIGSTFDSIFG